MSSSRAVARLGSVELRFNGLVELVEHRPADTRFGGGMRDTVDRTKALGDTERDRLEVVRRHDGVEESGLSRTLWVEHVTGHGGVIEMGRSEPVPGEHDCEPGQREPDPDFIES